MSTITIEDSAVLQKTRELCQTLLDEPGMKAIHARIDAFKADSSAQSQYQTVVTKGQALQDKQYQSVTLTDEEIKDFEQHRDDLLQNPVAKGFLDAQEELHNLKHSITKLVNKTIELGRIPSEEDLSEGCGGGCSCSH